MTIRERHTDNIKSSVGPGEYSPEAADKLTKPKTRVFNFDHPMPRKQCESSPDLGPGTYDESKVFGANLNKVTIG
jgi:hypothetical protein